MKRWIHNDTECRLWESPDEGFDCHVCNVEDYDALKAKFYNAIREYERKFARVDYTIPELWECVTKHTGIKPQD